MNCTYRNRVVFLTIEIECNISGVVPSSVSMTAVNFKRLAGLRTVKGEAMNGVKTTETWSRIFTVVVVVYFSSNNYIFGEIGNYF